MPLFTKSGSVTTSGSTTSVTGVGFLPVALQLWITVPGNGIAHTAAVWATNATISRYAWSEDNAGTTNTGSALATGSVQLVSTTGTLGTTGTITANNDGFTIRWGTTPSPAVTIQWLAIGGSDVKSHAVTGLVRNDLRNKRLTIAGVPFAPHMAMMLPADATGGNVGIGVAAGVSGSQQWVAATYAKNNAGTSDTQSAFFYGDGASSTKASVAWLKSDLSVIRGVTAFTLTGATVTFNALPSTNGVYSFAALFLSIPTGAAEAGTFTKGSGTNWTWTQNRVSLRPRAMMLATTRLAPGSVAVVPSEVGNGFSFGAGVATAADQWAVTYVDGNNLGTSDSTGAVSSTAILRMGKYATTGVTYPNVGTGTITTTSNSVVFNPNSEATNDLVGYLVLSYSDPYPVVITPKYQIRASATVGKPSLTSLPTAYLSNLGTEAEVVATVEDASLGATYFLGSPNFPARASATVTAQGTGVGFPITIGAGEAEATGTATATAGILGTQMPVAGSATGMATATGDLALNPRMASEVVARASVAGVFAYRFPTIAPAGVFDIIGTVNVALNPDYAIAGYWAVSSGTITTTTDSWHGTTAANVSLPASATLTLPSIGGLGLQGGNQWYGSVWVKNLPANMQCQLQANYSDGSHHHSSWHSLTASTGWARVGHNVTTSGGKVITTVTLTLKNNGGSTATFKADGLQIEEYPLPTPWVSGSLGAPAGVWLGASDVSPSYRPTLPMALRTYGTGGAIRVSGKLYRATWDNRWLDDLSPWVVDGSVSYSRTADVAWAFDCRILGDGWEQLTPYLDWVAPVLTVEYPDGTSQTAQLGLYLVMDSPERHNEFGYIVDLVANDPCHLLRMQGFTGTVYVAANTNRGAFVRSVLDSAVLTGGDNSGIRKRYVIPDIGKTFRHKREWAKETNKLELVNEVLWTSGYSTLFSTSAGMLTTRKRAEDRLRDRAPLRIYAANGSAVGSSDIVGGIATEPIRDDLENEVVILSDGVDSNRVHVRGKITGGDRNSRKAGVENNRRKTRKIKHRLIEDDATAGEVAEVLLEELGLRNERVTMTVIPEPELIAAMPWETVGLAVYNAAGNPVATGQYLVDGFSVGFTPTTALTKLTLARIDGLDATITVNTAEV